MKMDIQRLIDGSKNFVLGILGTTIITEVNKLNRFVTVFITIAIISCFLGLNLKEIK